LNRHEFLTHIHQLAAPRSYLEIGVNHGESLTLARTRTIAVDPEFKVNAELKCSLELVKATSDDFFARADPIAWFPEGTVDLAFIDGMHLFEFALRDFINVEKLTQPGSVVVFDDVMPRNTEEASRVRRSRFWAGDVYKVALALEKYRPDLLLVPVDTFPTGLLLVVGLDPTNRVLQDNYDDVVATFAREDPQLVPPEILNRSRAADPDKVIASGVLQQLCAPTAHGHGPDLEALRSLQGTATYLPAPYDNPAWPPPSVTPAKKAATKNAAAPKEATKQATKRPTLTRRLKRAVRAFLG
jgi:predicted O-methyltransferase YrrM